MQWPQFTVLVLSVLGLVYMITKAAKEPKLSAEHATWVIFGWIAYYAFYAYVLHAGGFW
jgi:hypothetical protein